MSARPDRESLPYRDCVGVTVFNQEGNVFIARRKPDEGTEDRTEVEAPWQMPQGGIDKGEKPWPAALRELEEETGIRPELVERIACSPSIHRYRLPDELVGKVWKGKWRGQRQTWFLYRFLGEDLDINLATDRPEFSTWRWVDPHELPALIVPFKRQLYEDVIAAFSPYLKG